MSNKTPTNHTLRLFFQTIIWFFSSALCLYIGLYSIYILFFDIYNQTDIITFHKAGITIFGVGMVLFVFSLGTSLEYFRISEISDKWIKISRLTIFFSLFIAIIGGQIFHYFTNYYTEKIGYEFCTGKNKNSIITMKITYAKQNKCIKSEPYP